MRRYCAACGTCRRELSSIGNRDAPAQVLETLAKTGQPSRAEITDAAMGERPECVMLNKGPHILEAIDALHDILNRMQAHQHKKRSMLRRLHW